MNHYAYFAVTYNIGRPKHILTPSGFFFLVTTSIHFHSFLLASSSVSLSYPSLTVPMRECSGEHWRMNFTFSISRLNENVFFCSAKQWVIIIIIIIIYYLNRSAMQSCDRAIYTRSVRILHPHNTNLLRERRESEKSRRQKRIEQHRPI